MGATVVFNQNGERARLTGQRKSEFLAERQGHPVSFCARMSAGIVRGTRANRELPLGMNALRRDLADPVRRTLARVMAETVAWGLDHRKVALDYAMGFARDLDREKADRIVGMYVNEWTRDAGTKGKEAVRLFLSEAADLGLVPRVKPEFQER